MRKFSIFLLLVASTMFLTTACNKNKKTKTYKEREIRVELSKLQNRIFRRQIPVQGTVESVQYAVLSAKISGTLELLAVSEGQKVKKGETLFGIDRQVLKNQVTVKENEVNVKRSELEIAKIALERSNINFKKAKLDFDRYETLWKSRATSLTEYENADVALKNAEIEVRKSKAAIVNAEAQVKQAEGNLIIAKKNLNDSTIIAPFDCTITNTYVELEEFVNTGTNILRLEDQNHFEIVCHISSIYYDEVKVGKTIAELSVFGVEKGRALVTYKSPSVDPESRTFKLKVRLPENMRIASGTLCDVKIIFEERKAWGLPTDAVLLRNNDRYIAYYQDSNKRAKSIEIKRGIVDEKYTEVANFKDYLDTQFVVTGQTFINNGALLQVIKR